MPLLISSPQMVSGRWLHWRMVSLQQRKAQSLSSSTLSSSKERRIYWKTSSARYSRSTYLFHLVTESGLSGARMGVPITAMGAKVTPSQCQACAWLGLLVPVLRQNLLYSWLWTGVGSCSASSSNHSPSPQSSCPWLQLSMVCSSVSISSLRKAQSERSKWKYIPIWHSLKISKVIGNQFI